MGKILNNMFYIGNSRVGFGNVRRINQITEASLYIPQYQAVLDAATINGDALPSDEWKLIQNSFLAALVNSGIFEKLDVLMVYNSDGSEGFKKLCWKRLIKATAVNSPTFSETGVQGDGASSYIDLNYNPATQGINYQLNSVSFGSYVNSAITKNKIRGGAKDGFIVTCDWSNNRLFINNSNSFLITPLLPFNFLHFNQNAGVVNTYISGVNVDTISNTPTAVPNLNLYDLARNDNNVPNFITTTKLALRFWGGDLSAQATSFNNAIQNYITASNAL